MIFKRLYAEYMYSYEKLVITEEQFNYGGLTAIIGKNLDQDTANGSGKSNILKAIYYLLFGSELNGVSVDDISNRVFGKGHFGEVVFTDKGREFKIQRFREYRLEKNSTLILNVPAASKAKLSGVRFFIDGEPFGDKKENGEERSITEINKIILNRLGVSPELFLASVMTAQDSKSNFLMASDLRKKELISELLDLQVYESAYDAIKKDIEANEAEVNQAESRVELINKETEDRQAEITSLLVKNDGFAAQLAKEFEEIRVRFEAASTDYARVKREQPTLIDPLPIEAMIDQKKAELSELTANSNNIETEDLKTIQTHIAETEGMIRLIEGDISRLSGQIQGAKANRSKLRDASLISSDLAETVSEKASFKNLNQSVANEADSRVLQALIQSESQKNMLLERKKAGSESVLNNLHDKVRELEESVNCPTCAQPWDKEHAAERDEKIKSLKTQATNVVTELERISTELSSDTAAQAAVQLKVLAIEKELAAINQANQEIESLETLSKDLSQKVEKVRKVLKVLTAQKDEEIDKVRLALRASQEKSAGLNTEIQKLSELASEARASAMAVKRWESSFAIANQRLKEIGDQAKQVKARVSPYVELMETAKARIEELKERREVNKARIDKLEEEQKYLNFWKSGFGPTGIRSFISDEVIIHLNEIVREYLNDLFDGAITVMFESESINQKGGVSNKISTKFYLNGKESPIDLLSGGERQRVVLAVDLALSDIAEARTGTKINLKFMDEPFNGIDSNGQMKSIALFAKIANHKNGFFIITHDQSFQALCQNTIFVVKKDEVSRVVTKEGFRKIS
jgi:DNA repair exonuclease SbcCD ATPase subunit